MTSTDLAFDRDSLDLILNIHLLSAMDWFALHLRLTSDGKALNDTLVYKVSDRAYDDVLRHLGGLQPGETKEFRPWKD